MTTFIRSALAVVLVLSMGLGSVMLAGCGSSSGSSGVSASAASADASGSDNASDDEQDDCYGDDLPAVKEK